MVIVMGNGHGDTSSNPGHRTNTLEKGMNPIILLTVGKTGFFSLCEATSQGEGKL